MTKTALIAGAGGAASKRLIETLLADPDWSVLALARTPRDNAGAADLDRRRPVRRARLARARSPSSAA